VTVAPKPRKPNPEELREESLAVIIRIQNLREDVEALPRVAIEAYKGERGAFAGPLDIANIQARMSRALDRIERFARMVTPR
jgi:hypothetical protein